MRVSKLAVCHALRPQPLTLALALAFAPALGWAQTLPASPTVVRGAATITRPAPGQMNVQQSTQNAIVNWQSFSIGAGGRVVFNQPNAQSIALNRVVGADPSSIQGSLSANGRVFIVNPNGVLFGAGSSVNVGGLVASTLDVGDDDFMAGRYSFTRGNAAAAGVVNDGSLRAAAGGVVALIGSTVENRGTIDAPQGTAALAAGRTVTLDLQGDGLSLLRVTQADLQALSSNSGTLMADGGRAMMLADATQATGFVVNQSGIVRARSLSTGPGGVIIAAGGGDASVTGSVDTTGGSAQRGGNVSVSGRNVGLLDAGQIDASGGSGGGHVELLGTPDAGQQGGMVAVMPQARIAVDATGTGDGGRVDLTGSGARLYGSVTARGGAAGGDGGLVKLTVGGGVDVAGMKVDASAAKGQAGTLDVDPFNVQIVDGSSSPPPPVLNPFVPLFDTTVFTGDINNALNNNTSVTITTGAAGGPGAGVITLGDFSDAVTISRTAGTSPVTLRLQAAGGIRTSQAGYGTFSGTIRSTAGMLDVEMSGNAAGATGGGGIDLEGMTIQTNGGRVALFGGDDKNAASGTLTGVALRGVDIDTRVGQLDANAGGEVIIRGQSTNLTDSDAAGVLITLQDSSERTSSIRSSTGAIQIVGGAGAAPAVASGVVIDNSALLATTSGAISITGFARTAKLSDGISAVDGVRLVGSELRSTSGAIDVRGRVEQPIADPDNVSNGVRLAVSDDEGEAEPLIQSGGNVGITGSVQTDGAGVRIESNNDSEGPGNVSGANVVIRAASAATALADPLEIGGNVRATGTLNIRVGGVDADGSIAERSDMAMTLGGGSGHSGELIVDTSELARFNAPTLVLGSDVYNNRIASDNFGGYGTFASNSLTLQTGPGGSIDLRVGLFVDNTLALVTGGAVTQATPANIVADKLLVRAGSASLLAPDNSVNTFAAVMGAGALDFLNSNTLTLGAVAAAGANAASNLPSVLDASSLAGSAMTVRLSDGNMTLAGNASATTLDLVTPGVFLNPGDSTIAASTRWRIWAHDWFTEDRGGLAGSGTFPNLYGCTFGAACPLTPGAATNTFIYTVQPTLSVTVDNKTRVYGEANPLLTATATGGLVNGDLAANIIGGTPATAAVPSSNVGNYAVSGTGLFANAGYILSTVTPGTLAVTPRPLTITADNKTRLYGDADPAFTGTYAGLASFDTPAALGASFTTPATATSNVGSYAIAPAVGTGAPAANYSVTLVPGTLAVTPATLTYVADPKERTTREPNPPLTGSVTGFKNEESSSTATTGSLAWTTDATSASGPGRYAVTGSGLNALNYVFVQAEGNSVALGVTGPSARDFATAVLAAELGAGAVEPRRLEQSTYVYDRNLGRPQMCVPDSPLTAEQTAERRVSDLLAVEWSRLRSRPNLANCFGSGRKSGCSDF